MARDEVDQLLDRLTRGEKAELLQRVARELGDSFPGIDTDSAVCGGAACLIRTRIPVWVLERARQLGTTEAALLGAYPSLRAEDLANAWAYVRAHRVEVEREIQDNEAE